MLLLVILGHITINYLWLSYWWLLVDIGDKIKLNYHRLWWLFMAIILMVIGDFLVNGYWWLNYHKLLVVILL